MKKVLSILLASLVVGACSDDNDEPSNRSPSASDVNLGSFTDGQTISFESTTLLSAATDPDNDVMTLSGVSVSSGSGTLVNNGTSWTYIPGTQELGSISLNYTVSDGVFSATANATLTIVDPSKLDLGYADGVTVYGTFRDASTRQAIGGLDVTLRVNGSDYMVETSSSSGAVTFYNVPVNTEYFVAITDPNSVYAPDFYSTTTPDYDLDVNNNPIIEPLSQSIEISDVYTGVATTISVKDISGGTAIEGLSLYYDASKIAEANGDAVSITGIDVAATETAGVYSFLLADNGNTVDISVLKLVDSQGMEYQPFRDDITNNHLTTLTPGNNVSYYVTSQSNTEFTIIYHLVNSEGHAYDAGSVLAVENSTQNITEYWDRVSGTTNEYFYTVTRADMSDTRIVSPIDEDADGFEDITAKISDRTDTALGVFNEIDRGSFDDNKELTLVYPLKRIDYDSSLQAEILSDDDNFQVNGLAEVIIAFDRPVELAHGIRLTHQELEEVEVLRALENSADVYDDDKENPATTTQGESSLDVDDGDYTYINDDGDSVTLSLGRDSTNNVVSTYATDYDVTETSIELSSAEYALSAGGTLLTITLDSSTLLADHTYNFEIAVKGLLDYNPAAFMSFSKVAKSNATTTLQELLVDNFDFKDAETYDPSGSADESNLPNQIKHEDKFIELNVGVQGGEPTDSAHLRYLTYALPAEASSQMSTLNLTARDGDLSLDSGRNVLYLVSKSMLSGTVQAVSQVETDFIGGAVTSETVVSSNDYFRLDLSAADISDNGDLSQFTSVTSSKLYLFDKPENHGLDDSAVTTVLAVKSASGAAIDSEGIYYVYELPLSLQTSGYIESVTLDFNVESNGVQLIGRESYTVK